MSCRDDKVIIQQRTTTSTRSNTNISLTATKKTFHIEIEIQKKFNSDRNIPAMEKYRSQLHLLQQCAAELSGSLYRTLRKRKCMIYVYKQK